MIPKSESEKYEALISSFSEVSRKKGRGYSIEDILDIIKGFEYFEDYEKCSHLTSIIKSKGDGKN
jgi:hypothetical protein